MSAYIVENNVKTKLCDECNGTMHRTTTDIDLKCGSKILTIRGIVVYKCHNCDNEVVTDEEFGMIEKIFESINKPEIDVLNLDETADLLRVSNQTIYNMIKENRLKAYKIGREWRFMRSDIQAYLDGVSSDKVWGAAAKGGKVCNHDMEIIQREAAKRGKNERDE